MNPGDIADRRAAVGLQALEEAGGPSVTATRWGTT
jgi:hypothetical protein